MVGGAIDIDEDDHPRISQKSPSQGPTSLISRILLQTHLFFMTPSTRTNWAERNENSLTLGQSEFIYIPKIQGHQQLLADGVSLLLQGWDFPLNVEQIDFFFMRPVPPMQVLRQRESTEASESTPYKAFGMPLIVLHDDHQWAGPMMCLECFPNETYR
jgi:hypothetical protein